LTIKSRGGIINIANERKKIIMKNFFSITEDKYKFEIMDLLAVFTVINVMLVLLGFWFAPIFGLVNCIISVVCNVKFRAHINTYIMQIALIVLNIYFLTL